MGRTSEMAIAIQDEIINTARNAENGNISHLDALLYMRGIRKELEDGISLIKDFETNNYERIADEAEDYPDGYQGHEIQIRNGRKTYDFKGIPEWEEANENKKSVEDKYKSMLNAKINGAVHANVSEDGEDLPLPKINYGNGSIVVKQKR